VDIEVEELGQRQSCERLPNLSLVVGNDLDKSGTSGSSNVVGANPPVRAQRLQLLLLVSSQRGELGEVRVVADGRARGSDLDDMVSRAEEIRQDDLHVLRLRG